MTIDPETVKLWDYARDEYVKKCFAGTDQVEVDKTFRFVLEVGVKENFDAGFKAALIILGQPVPKTNASPSVAEEKQ